MELSGTLISLRVFNNWGLGTFVTDEGHYHTVVGAALVGLGDGIRYVIRGQKKIHATHGEQIEVFSALPDVKAKRGPLIRFLMDNFKGCGDKTATRVVEWYQENSTLEELRTLLIETPWLLAESPPMQGKNVEFQDDTGVTIEVRVYRQLAVHLGGHGIADNVLRRLATYLYARNNREKDPVGSSWASLASDPYSPMLVVDGYGFATADSIGRQLDIPADAPCRLAVLIHHILHRASEDEGHVYLPMSALKARFVAMAPGINFLMALNCAFEANIPLVEEDGRYYLQYLYEAERYVAMRLKDMLQPDAQPIYLGVDSGLEMAIGQAEFVVGERFRLDDSQRGALLGMLRSKQRLHTLTAGPGCGKTAVMEVFVQVATRHNVRFAAPTGKAAKVLTSRIAAFGHSASTIHVLLEPSSEDGFAFKRNEENPLGTRVLVIDETSMQDLLLMAAVLRALPDDAHLILLGDIDQLLSVGAGRVLEDILVMPADHHRLHTTHRNRGGILELVQSIREGRFMVPPGAPDVSMFGDPGDPERDFDIVAGRYLEAIEQFGIEHVGFLIPRRKGRADTPGWNTTYANARLQATLNPNGARVIGSSLRLDDRIIVRRNLTLKQKNDLTDEETVEVVVNGDTGWLQHATYKSDGSLDELTLKLDDDRIIQFPGQDIEMLALAYCTTVHAAQGSEYRHVILMVQGGAPGFMNRKILYTAASRARNHLSIFGHPATLATVAARMAPHRFSWLANRVVPSKTPS